MARTKVPEFIIPDYLQEFIEDDDAPFDPGYARSREPVGGATLIPERRFSRVTAIASMKAISSVRNVVPSGAATGAAGNDLSGVVDPAHEMEGSVVDVEKHGSRSARQRRALAPVRRPVRRLKRQSTEEIDETVTQYGLVTNRGDKYDCEVIVDQAGSKEAKGGLVGKVLQRRMKDFLLGSPDGAIFAVAGDNYEFVKSTCRKKMQRGEYLYFDPQRKRILKPGNEAVRQALRTVNGAEQLMNERTVDDWKDFTTLFEERKWRKHYPIPQMQKIWWCLDESSWYVLSKDGHGESVLWDGLEHHDAEQVAAVDLEDEFECIGDLSSNKMQQQKSLKFETNLTESSPQAQTARAHYSTRKQPEHGTKSRSLQSSAQPTPRDELPSTKAMDVSLVRAPAILYDRTLLMHRRNVLLSTPRPLEGLPPIAASARTKFA